MSAIDKCTDDNTEWVSLENRNLHCKCIDVYDGDTVTLIIPFDNNNYKVKCRLLGVDTPEIRTKNKNEKKIGFEARDYLKSKILDKIIWVKFGPWGKFGGRVIATLYMSENDTESINDHMIDKGYAYNYTGKNKKLDFDEWYTS
jgi:micrococcal nuclease